MTEPDAPERSRRETIDRIVAFLREIGLEVRVEPIPGGTFVPGIRIERGVIVYDELRMLHPGDLLHEAGHLAVKKPSERSAVVDTAGADGAEEMAAIAWSYAAAVHVGVPASVVFHDAGYRGGASALREAFEGGGDVGLPMLQWLGLASDPRRSPADAPRYPRMLRWLRDERDGGT